MANLVEVVISAKNQASGPIKEVSGDLRGLEGAGSKMGSVLSGVGTVALVGLGAAAVTLGAGLVSSIGKATTFQQAIADVGSLVNATAPQMQALSDAALKLGQDTTLSGIGATDAAAAMAELAAAGFSVEAMTGGATRGVLLLASATGTDVARAAEIAGDTFNAFRESMGLTAADMPRIANLFTGAANVSSIGLEDIGESMKYIGPIAASMGISMEDVTAAIAALGNQGIKGSMAGTALRSVISSLTKPSKEATKVINDLGLKFFDGAGKMKDFSGISGELKTKLAGLTDQQRAAALVTLFGNEALSAANVLYGEGSEGLQQYIKDIAEQGDAAAIGAKRNNTLHGSIESLKGAFETAQIALGQAFLPALKDLADWAAIGVNAAIPLIQAWGPRLVSGIGSAIGALSTFGGYIGSAVTAMLGAWQKLQAGEITLASFIGGVKTLIATVLGDIGGLLGNVAGFVAPYLAAIGQAITTALPIVGAELLKLGQLFGGWVLSTAVPYLATNLPMWLSTIVGWVGGTAIPAIAGAVGAVGSAFGGWIQGTAIPYLTANLPLWKDALVGWVTGTAIPEIATAAGNIGSAFGGWIQGTAIPYLATNLPLWKDAIVTFITADAIPTIVGAVVGIGNAMTGWITTIAIPYLQTNLPLWKDTIVTFITADVVPTVVGAVVGIANAMSDWVQTTATPQVQAQLPTWLAAITGAIDAANLAANTGTDTLGETLGHFISTKVMGALTTESGLLLTALAVLGTGGTVILVTHAQEWAKALTDWLPGTKGAVLDGLGDLLVAINQRMIDSTTIIFRLAWEFGQGLGKGIVEGWQAKWPEFSAMMSALPGDIAAAVGNMASVLYQKGVDLVQGFINGINSKIGELIATAGRLASAVANPIVGFFDIKSPSRLAMGWGRNIVQGLIDGMDEKQGEAAKKAADVASAVAKGATDILGAIGAIAGYDFAGGSPTGETLGWFRHLAESIIQTLADVATMLGGEALANVKKATDATGQIGSAVKSTLEGFKALATYDFAGGSPTGDAMGWFRHLMESIVLNFAQAAALVGSEGMAQATAFGKTVADVVSASKGGLDLFAKLKESEDVPTKALKSLFLALDDALEVAGGLVNQAKLVREDALDFLRIATEAQQAFDKGLQILGSIGKSGAQSAPLFIDQAPGVSGGTFTVPGRATGGPVAANQLYMVGENGPEYFLPRQSGTIVPNGAGFGGGGGGGNMYISINVAGSVISEGQLVDKVRAGLLQKGRTVPTLGFN